MRIRMSGGTRHFGPPVLTPRGKQACAGSKPICAMDMGGGPAAGYGADAIRAFDEYAEPPIP
jgi:hypothetical protein